MKQVHFYQKVIVGNLTFISSQIYPHVLSIEHTNNYDSSTSPSTTEITIHGINNDHKNAIINAYQNSTPVDLYAGWWNQDYTKNDITHVTNGVISNINATTKHETSITFDVKDGTDYSAKTEIKVETHKYDSKQVRIKASMPDVQNEYETFAKKKKRLLRKHLGKKNYQTMVANVNKQLKRYHARLDKQMVAYKKKQSRANAKRKKMVYKAISFKPGTKGSTIIRTLAKKANIKIYSLNLIYDRKYLKGYIANKKPMDCITDVANDCQTPPFYRHGKLLIESEEHGHQRDMVICPKTGLINVQPQIDHVQKNAKTKDYSYQLNFSYRSVTTGDVFELKSDELSGRVIVLSGTNTRTSGSYPTSSPIVKLYSTYKTEQKQKMNEAKDNDRKTAKQMRDKQTKAALAKRKTRAAKKACQR